MELVQGQLFSGEKVNIDDKRFVDCVLMDCVLGYSGRPVVFDQTRIERCRYIFFGEARLTVQFLMCVGLVRDPSEWGEFEDAVN